MSHFVVTGPGGGSPNRLEINTFVKNDKYFSLYIQALRRMMYSEPQDKTQSFFQIGGIHGLPYIPWDGATVDPPVDLNKEGQKGGYCTHDSVLFPTWHRPYIALFEQILWKHAQDIAAKYTVDQAAWKAAATTLRQPYWDWAANSIPPAEVISLVQVPIILADGTRESVDNPLYRYKFNPVDPSFPANKRDWLTTLRQPTSGAPDAQEDTKRLKGILKNAQTSLRSSTYHLLINVNTWPGFSNHTATERGSETNSLEALHDLIHSYVGAHSAGHIGDPSVAGFDPIFYLHHCNVDRLLSLWSARHPGVWVSKGHSVSGSYTIPAGDIFVDENTNLTPFHNTESTFWASAGVTDTSKLGYTYPEFNGLDTSNPETVRVAIGDIVKRLYGSGILGVSPPTPGGTTRGIAPQAQALVTAEVEEIQPTIQHALAAPAQLFDWTARIEFKKFEIGSSFSVLLFLGEVPEDPREYLLSPNFVGAHAAFVNSVANRCENCQNHLDLIQEGYVHLSRGILEYGKLGSLDPSVVEPYLTKELSWRAIKASSSPTEISSLEVSVFSTPMTYTRGPGFPIRGDSRRHNGITYGRPGGSREAP